ncbi:hypothetical protein NEOLEDRAFT_1134059, partial [Neolentinus lepideus HHB14362 ss-1]
MTTCPPTPPLYLRPRPYALTHSRDTTVLHQPSHYELTMCQEPKQARMCGIGGTCPPFPLLSRTD